MPSVHFALRHQYKGSNPFSTTWDRHSYSYDWLQLQIKPKAELKLQRGLSTSVVSNVSNQEEKACQVVQMLIILHQADRWRKQLHHCFKRLLPFQAYEWNGVLLGCKHLASPYPGPIFNMLFHKETTYKVFRHFKTMQNNSTIVFLL